jgi:signal recognition particle receptor subunit beta
MADKKGTATTLAAKQDPKRQTAHERLVTDLKRVRQIAVEQSRNDLVSAVDQEIARASQAGAVTVVVAAEVSRGKSLLINALVAKEGLLPVDLDVSTGVYVLVQNGESAQARVFTRGAQAPTDAPIGSIDQWISVASNPGNEKGVAYVEVELPSPLLSEGISFIDTPGVGGLDTTHGETTLAALSGADALIFVLDASAPLSRPELSFLTKASERIESVILVMTKTDVFPGWRTILDEDRKLLKQAAPRFAGMEILRVRSPLFFEAMRRQDAGDALAADRLLERCGIPPLADYLREHVIGRAASIRLANGHRLALSVLRQLDAAYSDQLAALSGDTAPLQALQERQQELAEEKNTTEGWRQAVTRAFTDVNTKMNRKAQDEVVNFRNRFDGEIATSWRRGRLQSFPAEIEADLHLLAVALQRELAGSILECAGGQAERLKLDEFVTPTVTLTLPERERLTARPVDKGPVYRTIVGAGIFSGAVGVLTSIFALNPMYIFRGALGVATSFQEVVTQRTSAEQSEAKRLLEVYTERFYRDCRAAINDVTRAAADATVSALEERIKSVLAALQTQIQELTKQAAEVKEREASKDRLNEKRTAIAKLAEEHQAAFRDAVSAAAVPGAQEPSPAPDPARVSTDAPRPAANIAAGTKQQT